MSRLIPIISILILLALILGGYFFWWPEYQKFNEKKLELGRKDAEIKQKEEHLSGLESISAKLSEYTDAISKIDNALPTDPSVAALYYFFLKASSENGLILVSHNFGELYTLVAPTERVQKMPFSITLSGSYPAFKNFLSTIYNNVRLFEVDSISFSSPPEGESLFTFNLRLRTHAYKWIAEGTSEIPK